MMVADPPFNVLHQGATVTVDDLSVALWHEKINAESALSAAQRALSKAQREFTRAKKARDAARLRWLDAAEERVMLPDASGNPLMREVLEILDSAPRRRAAVR
ncbi:MAG: hypothetical protein EPN21_07980 [Methylococcaceae bacterium]|nr:MAG: hypothetical protein EPN21_07980 [Methylococcaceae bacterium]